MKNLKLIGTLFIALIVFASCSNDDDNTPVEVNEEELITTVNVNLVTDGGAVLLTYRDLDGDGPNDPETTVSGNFQSGATYVGTVELLNETENPAENITEEVMEEAEEHQVFYLLGAGIQGDVSYSDQDADGNPLGLQFTFVPGDAGTGTMTVVLRHEPKKPNDGTLADAGGETDISAPFNITIE